MKLHFHRKFCKVKVKTGYRHIRHLSMFYSDSYGIYLDHTITGYESYRVFCKSLRAFRRFLRKQSCFLKSKSELHIVTFISSKLYAIVIGNTK